MCLSQVHPEQVPHHIHELPRIVDSMHQSCYDHANSIVPFLKTLPVVYKWGGIMPFSWDGVPIIGQLVSRSPSSQHPVNNSSTNDTISNIIAKRKEELGISNNVNAERCSSHCCQQQARKDDGEHHDLQIYHRDHSCRVPGLWCISGLGGSGFMRGGMAGYLLAQVIAEGPLKREAEQLLKAADPARFSLLVEK
jgi:glycine/D-amino acid oxidase-like deaminating enzyme